ncbi:MAG: glycosyltransferase [Candidatus Hydrogenedentes bacterium]|nr:glycosyltransferase [Candidatus Hydrogenedentota bacterium]
MKLALLNGNRFNPWHMRVFNLLNPPAEVTAFRAESEIQQYFQERDDGSTQQAIEPIYYDTQAGPLHRRLLYKAQERYLNRAPVIVPFHERLQGYDIIQSWELFTDWTEQALEARRRFNVPLSLMVWDNIPFNMERTPHIRQRKMRAAQEADRFIVHSRRSARVLDIEGVAADKIIHADPGVDTDRFCPGSVTRTALNLPEDAFVILFVGWFLPRKGLDFLLLALRELLHARRPGDAPVHLAMVGSGPGRERVEKLIHRLHLDGHCTFAGSVPYDRMPEWFRASDVFVLPSIATPEWQEQFGMSLIEAMACGVPVISTWSGAIPEIVEDAGVLCQPNDFMSLFDALKLLHESAGLRKERAQQGRELALRRFTLARAAEALSGVYRGLLPG